MKRKGKFMINSKLMFNAGRWFMLPLDFLVTMGVDEAIVLAYLINQACREEEDGKVLEGEWFRCSTERLCNKLHLSKRQHQRIMGSLSEKGLIQRRMMGNPAKRHITIDFDALDNRIEEGWVEATGHGME